MRRVECVKNPPLTEYEAGKRYDMYLINNGDLLQYNVVYEDGTDSAFSPIGFDEYFIFI